MKSRSKINLFNFAFQLISLMHGLRVHGVDPNIQKDQLELQTVPTRPGIQAQKIIAFNGVFSIKMIAKTPL